MPLLRHMNCTRDGTEWLKNTVTVTMDTGVRNLTRNIPIVFSNPGSFSTRVEVCATSGAVLRQRAGSSLDTAWGYWKINVFLKTNRYTVGTFGLYDAAGSLVISGPALGRSASNGAMDAYLGNTPIGNYTGNLGPVQSDTAYARSYKRVCTCF